ncbi:MAG: HEAT repeat domain-containing protein [Elusimicrobiota bacterium]
MVRSTAIFSSAFLLAALPGMCAPVLVGAKSGAGLAPAAAAAFPKLFSNPAHIRAESLAALNRVLEHVRLETSQLAAAPDAERSKYVSRALTAYAAQLQADAAEKIAQAEDPVRAVQDLSVLKHRFDDLAVAAQSLESPDPNLNAVVESQLRALETSLVEKSQALTQRVLSAFPTQDGVVWHGRTALVPVDTAGSLVALKFAKPGKDVRAEGVGLERVNRFELEAPIPLPAADGYVRTSPSSVREHGPEFMAYVLPGRMSEDFFTYLGDALPRDWSVERKTEAVRRSALGAVDGMIRLYNNGWVHGSLAPLSHSAASWKWDYWRPAGRATAFEISRLGPSNIHNWDEGLSFANIRASGLADFEHLEVLPEDPAKRRSRIGQNIFELDLPILRSGYRNGLSPETIAAIMTDVLRRHAAGVAGADSVVFDQGTLVPLLQGIIRRFYLFHRVADALPRFIVEKLNRAVSFVSDKRLPRGRALVMPGEIVHSLVMDVIKPYVEVLFGGEHASVERTVDVKVTLQKRPLRDAVLAVLFGLETGAYLGRWGRFHPPLVWARGSDPSAQVRLKMARAIAYGQFRGSTRQMRELLADPDPTVRRLTAKGLIGREAADTPALIEMVLGDPDAQTSLSALKALKETRDKSVLAVIARSLTSPDANVRLAGAQALSWHTLAQQFTAIATALEDEDRYVRQAAAQAMRLYKGDDWQVLVTRALNDPNDVVLRGHAAEALVGHVGPVFLELAGRLLLDPNASVRMRAAMALIDSDEEGVLALIEKAFNDEDAGVRYQAVAAMHSRRRPGDVELLKSLMRPERPAAFRRDAAQVLAWRREADLWTVIASAVVDLNPEVRRYGAQALKSLPPSQVLGLLETVLGDSDAQVRNHGIDALKELPESDSLPLIKRLLASPDVVMRRLAAAGLKRRGDAESLPVIAGLLDDKDAEVRRLAAEALIGRHEKGVVALIEKALEDEDVDVQENAGHALGGRDDSESLALIKKLLASSLRNRRRFGVGALNVRNDAASWSLLESLLDDRGDIEMRRKAVLALGYRHGWRARARLNELVWDQDENVAFLAMNAIKTRPPGGVWDLIGTVKRFLGRR